MPIFLHFMSRGEIATPSWKSEANFITREHSYIHLQQD